MSDLQAGHELDALVAEKVMGLRRVSTGEPYFWPSIEMVAAIRREHPEVLAVDYLPAPEYSTNIAAAWQVVEHMIARDGDFHLEYLAGTWKAGSCVRDDWGPYAETAPLAICHAALAAAGKGA